MMPSHGATGGATRNLSLVVLAVAAAACASVPPRSSPRPADLPTLPRSSIAAVVIQRDLVGLDDEQVRRLEEIDQRRERADAGVRGAPRPGSGEAKGLPEDPGRPPQSDVGWGGGGRRRGSPQSPRGEDAPRSVEEQLDDNDRRAYLEAEAVLSFAQRERAREIASRYREELFERRGGAAPRYRGPGGW